MEYMTYKQFEELVAEMGYQIFPDEEYVNVVNDYDYTLARVSKVDYKILNLDWLSFKVLAEEGRHLLGNACWTLANTPLKDREELKKYRLKVYPKYSPFFDSDCDYLNIDRDNEMVISTKHETSLYKTIFTEEEINELASEYDLSLFERVEVEDEQ